MTPIKVLEIEQNPIPRLPEILATAVVRYGGLILYGVRVVHCRSGRVAVEMPSYPVGRPCPDCSATVPITNFYCGKCGGRIGKGTPRVKSNGFPVLYKRVVRPARRNDEAAIERAVLDGYLAAIGCRPDVIPMTAAAAGRGGAA